MKLTSAFLAAGVLFCVSIAGAQVTGSGTKGRIAGWTGTTTLGNSEIVQSGGNVGIGTAKPEAKLQVVTTSTEAPAVAGAASAESGTAAGVFGTTASSSDWTAGVYALASATSGRTVGVDAINNSPNGYAVLGTATSTDAGIGTGVQGVTYNAGNGVLGWSYVTTGPSTGVAGFSLSPGGVGVQGNSPGVGVVGITQNCASGCSLGSGIAGQFITGSGGLILQGLGGSNFAQVFTVDSSGNLFIAGNLSKGSGSFKIDHPLDPGNKYLSHSFVESPDMMNIYNGVVVLDSKGENSVELPEYFRALNSDFRYQLTAIGAPGPNLYVAEEICGNHFKIAGGKPGAKVSWQVTGIRQDAYAKAHRIQVEEDKPAEQKGHYLHPELFGATGKDAVGASNPPVAALPITVAKTNELNRH